MRLELLQPTMSLPCDALRGVCADSVWEHLAGTVSEPRATGEHRRSAVKVMINDRGTEMLGVKKLDEAQEKT